MNIPFENVVLPTILTSASLIPFLLMTITLLLAVSLAAHYLLGRLNPRWRVLRWLTSAVALLALVAMSFGPPQIQVAGHPGDVAVESPVTCLRAAASTFPAHMVTPLGGLGVTEIEAAGNQPFESRAFEHTEAEQTLDVKLQRQRAGQMIRGVVLLPDGKPAAAVPVALGTRAMRIRLDGGHLRRNGRESRTKTGDDGRFDFPRPADKFIVMAVGDAGFALATSDDDFEKPRTLRLKPWGRLEGRVMIGARPGAGEHVHFSPSLGDHFRAARYASVSYRTRADNEGRFSFQRAIPGSGSLSRTLVVKLPGGGIQHSFGWQQSVSVKPREPTKIQFGGTGRPVVGQVQLDRKPEKPIEWKHNSPIELTTRDHKTGQIRKPYRRYLSVLDAEGQFQIEDVLPGTYSLGIEISDPPDSNTCGTGAAIGRAYLSVTVPEPPADEPHQPFEVGAVTAELFDTLDVGERAPGFLARGLNGERIRLREHHGKVVVVDFWATWCAPSLAEMPTFRRLQKFFRKDPRFALLSLSCDGEIDKAREYVRGQKFDWLHGHVGSLHERVAQDYTVRSLPSTYLIGPDGRVIAKNLRGKKLILAVATALKNEELFRAAANSAPPARFPVVRFEPSPEVPELAKPPAVILLDDSESELNREGPGKDRLSFLSADGEELRVIEGLNNCQAVGGIHGVALDRKRGRIYVRENVADRITAFDLRGRKLWQVGRVNAGTLAVDPQTGHLWCSVGSRLNVGQTVVFDANGNEVAAFPHRAVDLACDAKSDAFWLVGYHITKINREGKVLFQRPVEGWCCPSVSVNPSDGSVWIAERDHPDVARSGNRLWHLDSAGQVLRKIPLGERDPFVVECDPRTGDAWVGSPRNALLRVTPAGEVIEGSSLKVSSIAAGTATDFLWVATETELLGLTRDGKPAVRYHLSGPSSQAWLGAF